MNESKRYVAGILSAATMMAGLMLVATPASWAQQKPLKEQLAGAWTLVSFDVTPEGGTKRPSAVSGTNPKGIMILDASGRFAEIRGHADRPKLKVASPRNDIPAAELGEVARQFGANFGTWSVNEADKMLMQKFEFAMIPNNNTLELNSSITLTKDELRLVRVNPRTGTKDECVYRRAR